MVDLLKLSSSILYVLLLVLQMEVLFLQNLHLFFALFNKDKRNIMKFAMHIKISLVLKAQENS